MTDVLIIGGGPIGLAAAIDATLAGISATVIEPRTGPIDKACGEGLMPGALAALHRLGVDPDGHPITGIGYQKPGREAVHRFRGDPGRGVRRTRLHAALAERATELGVEIREGKISELRQAETSVTATLTDGAELSADWLFGCDGLHSTVRELVGLGIAADIARAGRTRRFGIRRHFAIEPWSDLVEVHWAHDAEVYLTPVSEHELGIAVLGTQHTDFDTVVRSIPALAERLATAEPCSSLRGAGPFRQRTRARTRGRVMLVGDASGYVDAITGEGIRVGLAQAQAAIAAALADAPAQYERDWNRVTRDFRMLTAGLVGIAASPLRPAIVPLARALPGLYGSVVERLAR
ncbi:MAG: NAD(P)/FAD-dependent oxidoreductase [Terrimesophilobacter sp.]